MPDVKLSVGLDRAQAISQIPSDLKDLESKLASKPLKIPVKFEPTKESLKELQALLKSTAESVKAINNAAASRKLNTESAAAAKAARDQAQAFRELLNIQKQIGRENTNLQKMKLTGATDTEIRNSSAALAQLGDRYAEVRKKVGELTEEQRRQLNEQIAANKRSASDATAKILQQQADAQAKAAARAEEAQQKAAAAAEAAAAREAAAAEKRAQKEEATRQKEAAAAERAAQKKAEADERAAQKAEAAAQKKAAAEEKAAEKAAKAAEKEAQAQEKARREMENTQIDARTLSAQIGSFMDANRGLADETVQRLHALQEKLQGVSSRADLTTIKKQFQEIKAEAKAAGQTIDTFGTQLKRALLGMAGLQSADMAIRKVFDIYKQGIEIVHELDDSLIDLKKTTTMSSSELRDFYYDANDQAKQLGVTTKEIIQQAAEWSRLGFSSQHDASEMAALSSQFAIISPGMSVEDATTGLVSVMKAYGIEVDDVLDGIMSKINAVGNTAATNNAEIITGLRNSSSALAMVGGTLEDNIALFTAGQEIVQDASRVGNAIRTMVMRIRGYDEETGEISEDLANITGELIDLTKTANNPNGISVFTDSTQTQYKQLGAYLKEIAEIFNDLDVKTQQSLLEKLFGKRTATVGASILNNMEAYDKAMVTMANSAGSADREMSIVTESISYHLNQLKETWTGIAQDVFQSEQIIAVTDALTDMSNVIGVVVKALGPVGAFAAAMGAIAIIPKLGSSNEFAHGGCEPIAA